MTPDPAPLRSMPGSGARWLPPLLLLLVALALAALLVRPGWGRAEGGAEAGADGFADFVEPGFPFFTTTVDLRGLGPSFAPDNVATRGIVLPLGDSSYAVFDPDLLRMAVGWQGGFMDLTTMAQVSYHEALNKENAIPRIHGDPVFTTGIYPGWSVPDAPFRDPREPGPNPDDVGRGPIPVELGRWNGIHVAGDRAVLAYTVAGADIHEEVGSLRSGAAVGIARTFRVAGAAGALRLAVAEVVGAREVRAEGGVVRLLHDGDTMAVFGVAGAPSGAQLRVVEGRYVTLDLPPGGREPALFRVIAWRGPAATAGAVEGMLRQPVRLARFEQGGRARWARTVRTRGEISPDTAAYVVDRLALPLPNHWRRNVRVADLAFFGDGRRAAVVTFEGDVWIVSGIHGDLRRLQWRRFASGLYEPLGIEVVDDRVYVHGREGIVRLHDRNGDGEADFYENFTNLVIQSIESREFALGFAARPGGGFYLSKGGALDMGPRTAPAIMPGFRAGSRHAGSILEVSPDGRSVEIFASGFREPFIGVHPRHGTVTASDQQGHFVPATPLYLVPRGGYHGVPATAHQPRPPAENPAALWIPHEIDQSGASQLWLTGGANGFADDALIHLSYGRPGIFRVLVDSTAAGVQAALVPLVADFRSPLLNGAVHPREGHLYVAGFQIYGSRAADISALARVRYTGRPSPLPVEVRSGAQGIVVRFGAPLADDAVADLGRFHVRRWSYRRTEQYGSGHFRPDGEPGQERLPLAAAHLSADRTAVLLVVPDMKPVMQMAVGYTLPTADGRVIADTLYLTVNRAGELDLAAAGFGSVDWRGSIARAAALPAAGPAHAAASAEQGSRLFQRIGCVACHSTDGSVEGKFGPTMLGLFGSLRPLEDGTSRRADAEYLRESILAPAAAVVRGYDTGMPAYLGVLADEEVESLVLYIKQLGAGARR